MNAITTHYLKNAKRFGWGGEKSVIDRERVQLTEKFIQGHRLLDIGCGYGLYVDYFSKKGLSVTGVDFVSEFVQQAKKQRQGKFIKAPADKLPFLDNEFETSLLFNILEHGDDVKLLEAARRVTKYRLIIVVPMQVDEALSQAGVVYRHYIDKSHLREYTKTSLEGLARKTGLKIIFLKEIQPLYNETIFWALFGGNKILKKIIRKIVLFFLPKVFYPTELFLVLEK